MASKPGERKKQILQVLAEMLQTPKPVKITTAAIACRLKVSEAALYRHFASKAQMYDALLDYIEQAIFWFVQKIRAEEPDALIQTEKILAMLLRFAEKNPGMTRVMTGEAVVGEDDRLRLRVLELQGRLERMLEEGLTRVNMLPVPASGFANILLCFVVGRWQQYCLSEFKRSPMGEWPHDWKMLGGSLRA
ncbi:MAG TPA: nucleoid occlusion factor SlmA [Burkholderiales bacterium]|nr:nucleoid occlusion factor SlmA [Burkholderiales bacterium]